MSYMCKFCTWINAKHTEIAKAAPLSIQDNISALQKELWAAEAKLEHIHRLAKISEATTGFVNAHDLYDVLNAINPRPSK